jgi:type VI secretion system protein ImpC
MARAVQQKLKRVRPPKVHISYDVQTADSIESRDVPFVVGILGPFGGLGNEQAIPLRDRRFVAIDPDNFDSVLAGFQPSLRFLVENKLTEEDAERIKVSLLFRSMDDFTPPNVARQLAPLRTLLESRSNLAMLRDLVARNERLESLLTGIDRVITHDLTQRREVLDRIIDAGRMVISEIGDPSELLEGFFEEILSARMSVLIDPLAMLSARVADYDHLLSMQLNEILHHPEFQALEALWRGLNSLVMGTETSRLLRLEVLNINKRELRTDFGNGSDYSDSDLYRKMAEPLETHGRSPIGCLLASFEFASSVEDLDLLNELASMAQAVHAPLIASTSPAMFGLDSFSQLNINTCWLPQREAAERWEMFRKTEQARYVSLLAPRVLLRMPYGRDTRETKSFAYEEGVSGGDSSKYLWGSPVWSLGQRITNAFSRFGWFGAISGTEGGGYVEGLPVHEFMTNEGDVGSRPTTEVVITDQIETALCGLGFCSLCYYHRSSAAVFPRVPTCRRPGGYLDATANWNDQFAAQLQFVLVCCRFAQIAKIMARDQVTNFQTLSDCERSLNNWLMHYVIVMDDAPQDAKARHPLREARVVVQADPESGTRWKVALFLRPHFQMPQMTAPMRVTLFLPRR